jgi:DNA (cytosine-5)-methyltransferase 1
MGWENVFHCEWNEFGQKVLKHYWPHAKSYSDITKTDFSIHRGEIDVLTGGWPCQPFSTAGEQKGEDDERFLFPEMLRAVREIKPRWIVAENVRGIIARRFEQVFEQVFASLETEGYETIPFIIPASAVGAVHERYRVWFVSHSKCAGLSGSGSLLGQLQPKEAKDWQASRFVDFVQGNAMPYVCRDHHGLSRRLAEQALHGLGNAVVPIIPYEIFKAIAQTGHYSDKGVGK